MGFLDRFRRKQAIPAATLVDGGNPADPQALKQRQQNWQNRVLALANSIPEVSAAGSYIHNVLDRVTFTIEGNVSPQTQITIDRALAEYRAGRTSENIFFVGEMVVGYKLNTDTNKFEWSEYAHGEYKVLRNGDILTADKEGNLVLDESLKLFVVKRTDRSRKNEAYSPHRAMLEMMEAWVAYQALDNRLAMNRMSLSGFLIMPADDYHNVPNTPDGLPEPGSRQEFMRNLAEMVEANIKNPDPTKAAIPYTLFLSEEGAKAFQHKLLERVDDAGDFISRMDGYAHRYARGVDLPPEIVTGTSDANHWTAWKIDDDNWKYYLKPKAELVADALTAQFAKPIADSLEGRPTDVRVVVDATEIVNKPDRSEVALKLHEQGVITKEATVEATGFDEDDIDPLGEPLRNPSGGQTVSADLRRSAPVQAAAHTPKAILSAITDDIAAINHKLNERLNKIIQRYAKKLQNRHELDSPLTAASLDELQEDFGREIQAAVAKGQLDRLKRIYGHLGLSIKERAELAQATIDQRAQLAASVAVRQVNDGVQQAVNKGRDFVTNAALAGQLISISHGSPDITNERAGVSDRPFDAGLDPMIQQPINEAGITYRTVNKWVHGNPENPYEPHEALDGETWSGPEQERAVTSGRTPFSNTGQYYPGDHKGCTCEYDFEFVPVEA